MPENFVREISSPVDRSNDTIGDGWIRNPEFSADYRRQCHNPHVHVPGECQDVIFEITNAIDESEELICVSSFIIQETEVLAAIKNAAERGIRVYILTAAEELLQESSEFIDENYFEKKERVENYKSFLGALSKLTFIRTGGMLHSKFILVDPETRPRGFLLTSNITDKALHENKELVLQLDDRRTRNLFKQFRVGFWSLADKELLERTREGFRLRAVKRRNLVQIEEPGSLLYQVGSSGNMKGHLTRLVNEASHSIDISAWSFKDVYEVSEELLKKMDGHVTVRIFTRPSVNNIPFLRKAAERGAIIFSHPLMHAKSLLVDDKLGAIFTANIDNRGLDEGFESGFILNNDETRELSGIFDGWARQCETMFKIQVKAQEGIYGFRTEENGRLLNIPIDPDTKEVLHEQPVFTETIEQYLSNDWFPEFKLKRPIALTEKHCWRKLPPRLPAGCKPYALSADASDVGNFKLFTDTAKKIYLVIENMSDLPRAMELSNKLSAKIVTQGGL